MIPPELPPEPADQAAARSDAINALSTLAIEAEIAYRASWRMTRAELAAFVEQAKQRLNVVATAAAVLP